MTTLRLLIALLGVLVGFVGPLAAAAQDTPSTDIPFIESAEVSGLPIDQLSPGLRQDIEALAGLRLDRERLQALAARIESEHPDVVAATRDVARPDGRVRVVFLVARISDDTTLAANINARYIVERVEIAGIDESKISQELRDALQALVGRRLDSDEADRLADRLEAEQPDYDVGRRVSRGSEAGKLDVVFTFTQPESRRWIRFPPSRSKLIYQEGLGWSGVLDIQLGGQKNQFSLGLAGGNNDDLVEEYSGYWLRFANREAGTRRLGVSLEFSAYEPTWEPATLSFLDLHPAIPGAYGRRVTVQPELTFALHPRVRVTGGISMTELDPLSEPLASVRANAAIGSIGFDQSWRPEDTHLRHRVNAVYQYRGGTTALDSDLSYTRHYGQARYELEHRHTTIIAEFRAGRLTGTPPLFERFTLGDSATLRGWNKYDVAPAGGDRVIHQSIDFRYRNFAYFFDAGSVWSPGEVRELRYSTGIGFQTDHAFALFAWPLNAETVDGKFLFGIRF